MTLVICKTSTDWSGMYDFDIPYELGQCALGESDIDAIMEALGNKYGATFTESRQDAVELILQWVGRGHYSDSTEHDDHNFLTSTCVANMTTYNGTTINYSGNCTAGTSEDFAMFILEKMGKANQYTNLWTQSQRRGTVLSSDYSNCKPGDLLVHKNADYDYSGASTIAQADMVQLYMSEQYVFFLGVLDEDLTLASGQVLKAGEPLTVTLEQVDSYGNIWLTGKAPASSATTAIGIDTITGNDNETKHVGLKNNFWWLSGDTANTRIISFE
jgi:hypothetical protein